MFSSHSFTCSCLVFPAPLIEGTVCSPFICSFPCSRLIDHKHVGLYPGFLSVPEIYVSVFMPVPCRFCCVSLWSEVWKADASSFIAFSHDCFGKLGFFVCVWFHINFKIICSSSVKKMSWIFW